VLDVVFLFTIGFKNSHLYSNHYGYIEVRYKYKTTCSDERPLGEPHYLSHHLKVEATTFLFTAPFVLVPWRDGQHRHQLGSLIVALR
jgi:hypothetical protein